MFNTTVSNQIATLTMSSPPVKRAERGVDRRPVARLDHLSARNDWKCCICL